MKNKDLIFYNHAFLHLKRDHKNGGAPHKPIMLLSLIDAIENGFVEGNRIYITPELIGYFKANWSALVETKHDARFALPFYHLSGENSKFWRLIPNDGCEIWVESKSAMRNLGNLQTAIRFAEIDKELAIFLFEKVNRDFFRQVIMEKYFPNFNGVLPGNSALKIIWDIENQIVEESSVEYQKRILELKKQIQSEEFVEEIAIRCAIFKRKIPQLYAFTCCVSGYKVDVSFNSTTLIEACHIKPFRIACDDTLTNGIALCPTFHTAFDAGLFTISDSLKVVVSNKIKESQSPQNLSQFHGTQIKLPEGEKHFPNLENIKWHREKIFEKGRW